MIDKEKVVKGLEACELENCDECPYWDIARCRDALIQETIQLLEEQEKIIAEYHKADGFLTIHGWKWAEELN